MLDIKKLKKNYTYHDGVATVEIITGDESCYGHASCSPEDEDFESEKTGLYIADARAEIAYLSRTIKYILKPQLKILEHLENGVNAKEEKDRNGIMIYRAANQCREEIKELRATVKYRKEDLREYIKRKDELHKKLRARRSKLDEDKTIK